MNRLRAGYVKWTNPFNQRPQYVSFERTRVVVFWSKDPQPLLRYLDELEHLGIAYYVQFTLNDYEREGLEPGVPPLGKRIRTFAELSRSIGRDRIVWRFDPLILSEDLTVDELLKRIEKVGDQVSSWTSRLVFSFVDIALYRKVRSNLAKHGGAYRELDEGEIAQAAAGIATLCRDWGIRALTCAEAVDLAEYGIGHNKCIDDDLILKITSNDLALRRLLRGPGAEERLPLGEDGGPASEHVKDTGQREACQCAPSKDIGQYNTCPHLCIYCYANTSATAVRRNVGKAVLESESITGA